MFRFPFALLCAFLVISTVDYAVARKSFGFGSGRHSYPKSSGHSGGGSHSYPSHGGLSGGGHGYPSAGRGGSHGYPASGGLSGHGSGGSANTHHSGSHGYPASTGLSGNRPASGVTNVHHNYHYSPPQQISYAPRAGAAPISYPVYHGTPPTYVYQYKDSGSKYGTLLTGLALLNLGALAGTAYAHSRSHPNSNYVSQPGELCKFGVKKANGDYEETKIDCQLMSSFIFQEEAKQQSASTGANTTTVVTSVTNVTTVNATGTNEAPAAVPESVNVTGIYTMYSNGTLVPLNTTANHTDTRSDATSNNSVTSTVTTQTNTTTTVTNALDVKGQPIDVTPGMECYVLRTTPSSRLRRKVPCGLLQTYAEKSLRRNSASRATPAVTILAAILTALFVY